MNRINLNEAERSYPRAFNNIKEQVAHLKQVSDADIVPMTAAIIEVKGVPMLEVICMTDLVMADTDEEFSPMRFRAFIHDPASLKKLH